MERNAELREKLLKIIEVLGMKQSQFAKELEITPAYLCMWLKGTDIGDELLDRINNVLKQKLATAVAIYKR